MVQITLENIIPAGVPADGWIVKYRIKGSGGAYTTVGPFVADPIIFTTTDPAGTLYEGTIRCDCGSIESVEYPWETPCDCTDGTYTPSIDNLCKKTETTAPTVTNAGYCLAPSTNGAYSNYESRIYNTGYTDADMLTPFGTIGGIIFARMTLAGQWANPLVLPTVGPMNREGVWIDSDCDGTKNPLGAGVNTTIATQFNNAGTTRVIYVGVGADNRFKIVVNGVQVVDSVNPASELAFKIWHIIPITITPGLNIVNVIVTGDGSSNDSVGMVVYDNTPAAIAAATDDSQLNILFASHTLRGTTYDTATCPATYSLDSSGGPGNYICRRVLTMPCNSA